MGLLPFPINKGQKDGEMGVDQNLVWANLSSDSFI